MAKLLSRTGPVYSDFTKTMERHPFTDDLLLSTDVDSIKESIRNIIMTNKGERLFQPKFGTNIRALLFKNMTTSNLRDIRDWIRDALTTHEPRITLNDVQVSPEANSFRVKIVIIYTIAILENPIEYTMYLERNR